MKSISEFFAQNLEAPLKNVLWSWGAETESAIFLRVWAKDLQYKAKVVCVMAEDWRHSASFGLPEREAHLKAIEAGKQGYMIICDGHQDDSGKMVIDSYRSDSLFPISSIRRDGQVVWASFDQIVPIEGLRNK